MCSVLYQSLKTWTYITSFQAKPRKSCNILLPCHKLPFCQDHDLDENFWMAVIGAHNSSNTELCCSVTQRPSLSSGLAKTSFPAVHLPVYKEVEKQNEAAHLHSYLNASNWCCLHVIPTIPGCCPKRSCKRAKELSRTKVCSNSSLFYHLWCFIGFQHALYVPLFSATDWYL